MNKTIAISDLHGHFDQWMLLYNKLLKEGSDPKKDTFVFLGDYVDGGGQTKQLLDWLIQKEKEYPHWVFLYGNHEDLMLDALSNQKIYGSYDLWWNQGGRETYKSYFKESGLSEYEKAITQVKDVFPENHIKWLKERPLYYDTDNYFFVHAGLLDGVTIEEHKEALKKEIHGRGSVSMSMIWLRDEFYDSNYNWEKKIIFGHTVFKEPLVKKNMIGLDGMFHNAGNIHALTLPEEKIISVHSNELSLDF